MSSETKDNFEQETMSHLKTIESHIESAESYNKTYGATTPKNMVEKLNVLKLNKYKVKEIYESIQSLSEEEWIDKRTFLQEELKKIIDALELETKT